MLLYRAIGCVYRHRSYCRRTAEHRLIFSDDHAYQAIGAYDDPRKLVETPHIDRLAKRGDAVRPLRRAELDLRAEPRVRPDRQVFATSTASTTTPTAASTAAQTTFPKLLQAAGYQTAVIGKWHLVSDPTGFDDWHILPGQGRLLQPADDPTTAAKVQHEGYVTDVITDLSPGMAPGAATSRSPSC